MAYVKVENPFSQRQQNEQSRHIKLYPPNHIHDVLFPEFAAHATGCSASTTVSVIGSNYARKI